MIERFANEVVIRLATTVQTVAPESVKALEDAWRRRRQELAGWQPSGGWLIDARMARAAPQRRAAI